MTDLRNCQLRHRVEDPRFFAPLTDAQIRATGALWSIGEGTAEIAAEYGRHESIVYNALEDIRRAARSMHREAAE